MKERRREPFPWKQRRWFLYLTTGGCALSIGYCLGMNLVSAVAETAVTMAFIIIGTNVGSYVFGAAWQDITMIKAGRGAVPAPPYSEYRAPHSPYIEVG